MRLTLAVGLITVIATSAVAIFRTSRLVANDIASRESESLQTIEDTLFGRLADAQVVAARLGQALSQSAGSKSLTRALTSAYPVSAGLVRSMIVVDAAGRPVAAAPSAVQTLPADARDAATEALRGSPGVMRGKTAPDASTMWLSQTVVRSDGKPVVLLLSLDTSFLGRLVGSAAIDGRSVYLLEHGNAVLSRGRMGIDFTQATWTPDGEGLGVIEVSAGNGLVLTGHYDDVEGVNGIALRLVILEPSSVVVRDTLLALLPSFLVLGIGGIIALLAAWLVARRLVSPLRALESAARRAASGGYVKAIDSTREDEIGRVADAFNAVALRLNALHDLSQLLASSSRLDEVLDGILSAMERIVGPGVSAVYLLDEGGRWLAPVAAHGADVSTATAIDSLGDTWLSHALLDGEPASFRPTRRTLAEEFPGLVTDETGALMAPLMWSGEALGVVVVLRPEDAAVSEAEYEMVRTFSAQAAVAVHNSRLFAVESELRRVAEGLRTVAEHLVRGGGLPHALADVETTVADLFGAVTAAFAIIDRRGLGLQTARDRATESEMLGFALRALARADSRRPLLIRPGEDERSDAMMQRLAARELLVIPIALESDHGAVLVVAFDDDRANRRDIELAEAVGNEIALSFDNAFFYQQALTRADNLETVFRISQAVGSSLDVKVVLNRVLDVVQKILSADAVALMTYDARLRTISTEMARGAVSPSIVERVFNPGDDVVGYVFESGEPVAFRDMHEGMGGLAGDAARHGLRSMLAVPLLARGRSIGVLTVFAVSEGSFGDEDMNLLQTFASQASLAIDTARSYSREHEVASVLQRSLLPEALPDFPELETASFYEPAGGDAEIGGDYYDVFRAPDSTIWLSIADVCGKGVRAATKTSMIKYAVRSFVASGFSPGRVIGELNRMVADSGDTSDIVTLWVGRVDVEGGRIMWSAGGHPAGLLRRAESGEVVRLASTGPLLGAIAGVTYMDESTFVGPGDELLLYTDGVTEARSGNTFFGEGRVEQALAPGGTAEDVVERLTAAVRRFVQSDLRDDVAVLAVKVLPT